MNNDFTGKRVLIVGMARSGISSAKLLMRHGALVTLNDMRTLDKLNSEVGELISGGATDALGLDPMRLIDTDMIIVSPAVPFNAEFIKKAQANGIEVIGEIELGYRFSKAPLICVTGTNGKTTTTALTGEIFRAWGKNTYVLGNIGIPITEYADQTTENDIIVAEVAGFQLQSTVYFHSPSCTILNVTEDHLNYFKTMENYAASKEIVFHNQTPQDFVALNADNEITAAMVGKPQSRVLLFSRLREVENGAFVRNGNIIFRLDGREQEICPADSLRIPGAHNLENALAATAVSMAFGVDAGAVKKALQSFEGVEHRIEFVCEKGGVRYINDSKGTNPDSTIKAVEAAKRPTVLILGGSNKNSDYTPVFRAFGGMIKAVVALGETRNQILRDADKTGYKDIYICDGSFKDAVLFAAKLAQSGDDVLLSPACASYDMFDNFEQRGRVFKEIVGQL